VGCPSWGMRATWTRRRRFAHARGKNPFLIAKIERKEALKNLRTSWRAADGLMVARGDLGVELPFNQIPAFNRTLWTRPAGRASP